jgi:hypothetical protein
VNQQRRVDVAKQAESVHRWQCLTEGTPTVEEHQAAQEAARPGTMLECLAAMPDKDLKKAGIARHE